MTKEEILKNITDDEQRKSVSTFLDFAESAAKSAEMTADKFNEMFESKANELEIETAKVKGLQEQLDKMGSEISAMKEKAPENGSITESIEKAIEANKDRIIQAVNNKEITGRIRSEFKTIDASSFTNNRANYTDPIIGEVAQGYPFLMELLKNKINVPSGNQGSIDYWYQNSPTNNAGSVAENGEATESDYSWTRGTLADARVSAKTKVSLYQLSDMSFLNSQVRRLLATDFMLKLNDLLINGLGAGTDPYGVLYYATEFAYASYADTVTDPDLVDMLNTIKRQIIENGKDKYMPNNSFMKYKLMWDLQIAKDDFGRTKYPNIAFNNDIPTISGIKAMTNELSGTNELVVGDFNYAQLYMWDNMALDIFQEEDDRSKKKVTLQIDARLNLLVKPTDTNAIVKVSNYTDALDAIKKQTA